MAELKIYWDSSKEESKRLFCFVYGDENRTIYFKDVTSGTLTIKNNNTDVTIGSSLSISNSSVTIPAATFENYTTLKLTTGSYESYFPIISQDITKRTKSDLSTFGTTELNIYNTAGTSIIGSFKNDSNISSLETHELWVHSSTSSQFTYIDGGDIISYIGAFQEQVRAPDIVASSLIAIKSGNTALAQIDSSGALTAASVTSNGAISGTTGTFTGAINGTTGTFTGITVNGTLTANTGIFNNYLQTNTYAHYKYRYGNPISTGTNLNSLTAVNRYISTLSSNTFTNSPVNGAFELYVYPTISNMVDIAAGSWSYGKQVLIPYNKTTIYTRSFSTGSSTTVSWDSWQNSLLEAYPVGSIYLTVGSEEPGELFGGTWTKMSGGYLYGAASTIGNTTYTGTGTQSHALTTTQMPSHTHSTWGYATVVDTSGSYKTLGAYGSTSGRTQMDLSSAGGGGGHSHNVAYIAVWIWKRTA